MSHYNKEIQVDGITIIAEQVNANSDNEKIRKTWAYLSDRCHHHYFLSWGWISTWLASLPAKVQVLFIHGVKDHKPLFCCFVGVKNYRKFGLFPTHAMYLQNTGVSQIDSTTMEYNEVLSACDQSITINALFHSNLFEQRNEFVLPGIRDNFYNLIKRDCADLFTTVSQQASYYIDLQHIRNGKLTYDKCLSSNKRHQIKRSIKEYEKGGKIAHHIATSADDALKLFSEMGGWHQNVWSARGKQGAFANTYWVGFHEKIIRDRFLEGEIHISRFSTENCLLGYIYGFTYNQVFYFMQCGFNYLPDNKLRPGLVAHYLLIQYFMQQEYASYDFLAGDSAYKKSLATNTTNMYWACMQKQQLRFLLSRASKKAFYFLFPNGKR